MLLKKASLYALAIIILINGILLPFADASIWEEQKIRVAPVFNPLEKSLPEWIVDSVGPYASIQYVKKSDNPHAKTILVVEDAHLQFEAQRNIAEIIEALGKNKPENEAILIGLEGSAKDKINFQMTNAYPRRDVLKEAALALLKKKIIKATELAVIGYPKVDPPFVVSGVENRGEFNAHIEALKNSVLIKKEVQAHVELWREKLNKSKKLNFNPTLISFDNWEQSHAHGFISTSEYVIYLNFQTQVATPQLKLFLKAARIERSLDVDKLVGEHAALIQSLRERKKSPLTKYPEIDRYIQYVRTSSQIKTNSFLTELMKHERKVQMDLAETRKERELIHESQIQILTQKLIDRKLAQPEWNEYKKHQSNLDYLKTFEEYYEIASRRSHTMAHKMTEKMAQGSYRIGVLVAGGFHTNEIIENIPSDEYNIISLSPYNSSFNKTTLEINSKHHVTLGI